MDALSNYTEADLEALVVDQLQAYLFRGRRGPRALAAAGRAADALWEIRVRQRLANGERDLNGLGPAYRAIASRIYHAAAPANEAAYQQVSTAMQRRMSARRQAYLRRQEEQS